MSIVETIKQRSGKNEDFEKRPSYRLDFLFGEWENQR